MQLAFIPGPCLQDRITLDQTEKPCLCLFHLIVGRMHPSMPFLNGKRLGFRVSQTHHKQKWIAARLMLKHARTSRATEM